MLTCKLRNRRCSRQTTNECAQESIDSTVAFAELIIDWYLEERRKDDNCEDPSDAR